eukprot:gene4962-8556_t
MVKLEYVDDTGEIFDEERMNKKLKTGHFGQITFEFTSNLAKEKSKEIENKKSNSNE